jgi:LAO/AO transport system kinase
MIRGFLKNVADLLKDLRAGDRRTIARCISLIENDTVDSEPLLRELFRYTGTAYRIGVTGPLGSGKSTITNKLTAYYRVQGKTVGIIAVDPTSPFTGGAVLGDRIRMTDVETDDGVFIRSMASRGSLGGLSKKAREAADVLDASGKDIIILETVGVGQSEIDIVRSSDTTLVVLVPESGDAIQAMKAGLMEIADIFVLNKSDRSGADQAAAAIESVLKMRTDNERWFPPVLKTIASRNIGIGELGDAIEKHRTDMLEKGIFEQRRLASHAERIEQLIAKKLQVEFWTPVRRSLFDKELKTVKDLKTSPYELADILVEHFKK